MHPQIRENFSLKEYNTFGIRAASRYMAVIRSVEELEDVLNDPALSAVAAQLVLGGGSNILFTRDFDGICLVNEMMGISIVAEDEAYTYVRAGAGVNWHHFVMHCVQNNYAGVENLALIPGSVGASPMQNIGAYGVEVKDVFHQLEAFHLQERQLHIFEKQDCAFGYRESVFKKQKKGQYVITSVTFRLHKNPVYHTEYGAIREELQRMQVDGPGIHAIAHAVMNIRRLKLPDWKELGNAGSFFKNPIVPTATFDMLRAAHPGIVGFPQEGATKLAAGWLIETCGWKGFRRGDAGCYAKQALVLVNYGNAVGTEIYDLSEEIIQSVKSVFGVQLEREVNVV